MNKLLRPFLYFSGITAVLTLGFLAILAVSKFDFSVVKIDAKSLPRIFIIESGSMEPAIKTGGVVVVSPSTNYQINDVVTFSYDGNKENMVTHRIEYRGIDGSGEMYYLTSGDANNTFDGKAIKDTNIVGKVVYTLPYLGYFADFAKRPQGFILLIVVPATIIIYEELKNLWKHLRNGLTELHRKLKRKTIKHPTLNLNTEISSDNSEKSGGVHKAAVVIPVFGAFLLFLNFSSSFFSDTESSVLNSFTAYVPTPTSSPPQPSVTPTPFPLANHLVINEVLYDTSTPQNISGAGGSNRGEFVEIYNPTSSNVDLSGWTIEDNQGSTGADNLIGILPPGGYLIVTGGTEAEFEAIWGAKTAQFIQATGGSIGNGLANGGDRVVIKNGSTIVDMVSWGTDLTGFISGCTATACPTTTTGTSLERNPAGYDTDSASDFITSNPPTPGD